MSHVIRMGLASTVLLSLVPVVAGASCSSEDEAKAHTPDSGAADVLVPDAPSEGGCFPSSCGVLGAECGVVDDGCGHALDCGQCANGKFCGGAGANRCGSTPCFPKTCADFQGECGLLSDGCAAVITCATCQPPETCGGAGVAHACGCKPATCASLGVSCGKVTNGCGSELDCGPCTAPPVCGNGACESGESGATCAQDCCDAATPCTQTKQNQGIFYCRRLNAGAFQWLTEPQALGYCDEPSEVCVATYSCAGESGTCAGIPGKWIAGPCPVCGDGTCSYPEDGNGCPSDCCDASTPCDQTKQNQGILYCRQINGQPYQWYTEAEGMTFCDEQSEICSSTFKCGGASGTCKTIPGGWVFGPC